MKYRFKDASVIAITILLLASVALAQNDTQYKELPNFHKVNDHIYRGAQPRKGGIKRLSELGIKTIINLRHESDDTRAERREAEAAGIKFFNVPMATLGRPSDGQVARVLELINDSENSPVFIHCQRGSDRTGMIVALYRTSREGWTVKQALTEAKQHGMRWIQFAKKHYVADYHRGWIEKSKDAKTVATDANAPASNASLLIDTGRGFDSRFGRSISAIEYSIEQTRHALTWFFKKAAFAR